MTGKKFQGVFTAIITPFKENEEVDFGTFGELIEAQIKGGVGGIVPCGTTGESPTLSHEEHKKVVEFAVQKAAKRCLVIAGTGSNSTREAIELTQHAERAGADGALLVNPYYNKPTQEGLYRHFKSVADSVQIPIIIYNIKGRTAVNVETATLLRIISACKNVLGVKEASGDINQIKDVIAKAPPYFSVLSGDDNLTFEVVKSGGSGIVSVASNLVPEKVVGMVNSILAGKIEEAQKMNDELMLLFKGCFIETNPIPIKAMLSLKGACKEVYRLPMCEMSKEHKEETIKLMKQMNLL